ncbi:MAG TPA: glycosyltransferase [Aggregatilineaceae bacterium]|nr:glycosyltransferase [Aggregatilineaceae bacterium]
MSIHPVIHLSKMTGAAGSEGHLLILLPGLRARGVDARLWILVEPDNPVQEYVARCEALGIPTERIVIHGHLDPTLWWRLAKRFRQVKPAIVHTHLLHADLYGLPAARLARVPHIVNTQHADDPFRRKWIMRMLHHILWRIPHARIAISDAIRQFAIEVEGSPRDRISTVYYGLDLDRVPVLPGARTELCEQLQLPPDALIVGSVCRLVEVKALSDALQGFAQIVDQVPEAHYVIAGDGPLRGQLEAEALALGLDGRVHFLGWRSDPYPVFAALDVLLAPSIQEGFGLIFLEAMAVDVPAIGTRVSAIPEVIAEGETGWLVPLHDPDAIAAALLDALTNPEKARAFGAAGRQRLEANFTAEKMIDRTLAVYRSLDG